MTSTPIVGVSPDLTQPAPATRPPDFEICDTFYGHNLNVIECYKAAEQLPQGDSQRGYGVAQRQNNPAPYHVLPFSIQEGGCYISVEPAGPVLPQTFGITPNDLRSRAASTIQRCVINNQGVGGFATHQFGKMYGFLMDPNYISGTPVPETTAFLTITVSGPESKLSQPGNKDKQFAVEIAGVFEDKSYHYEEQDNMEQAFRNLDLARSYLTTAANMAAQGNNRGKVPSWWIPEITPPTTNAKAKPNDLTFLNSIVTESEVNYECDPQLGSPSLTDCTSLQTHDLGPDSDTLQIRPGDVTFLHQNTCTTAITSSIPLVLTWEQVRWALAALITTCMLRPSSSAKGSSLGGRAFHELQRPIKDKRSCGKRDSGTSRRRRKRREMRDALPLHANVTLFQQQEPWKGEGVEQDSCTWKAVVRGVSVGSCSRG